MRGKHRGGVEGGGGYVSVTLKLLYTPFVICCTLDLTHTHVTTGMDLEAMNAISSLHIQYRLCVLQSECIKLNSFHVMHFECRMRRSVLVFVLQLCFTCI